MHPILLKIGSFEVPAYGASLVLAFVVTTWFLKREAGRQGLDGDKMVDTAIAGLLFGLVGAKLLLFFLDPGYYVQHPVELLRSAGVIYGGLMVGVLGVIWFIKRKNMPLWKSLDTLAPFAALGVGLGRISCLMAGCCYGIRYDGPFSIVFPSHPYCRADPGIDLFPIQILALVNGVLLCLVLLWILRNQRFPGQVVMAYLMLYSLTRGTMEFLRGDDVERGKWFADTVSTSQVIAIIGLLAGLIWYLKSRPKEHVA